MANLQQKKKFAVMQISERNIKECEQDRIV